MTFAGITWTPDEDAELVRLWSEGKKTSQIAAQLSREGRSYSRNAIAGRMSRLREKMPGQLPMRGQAARRPVKPKPPPAPAPRKIAPARPLVCSEPVRRSHKIEAIADAPPYPAPLMFDAPWPRSACRWPVFGDRVDPNGPVFCGAPVALGSYCACHARKSVGE
jgi:hypothetical protein